LFFFFKQKTAYEMLRSLVGSEMCIRDSVAAVNQLHPGLALSGVVLLVLMPAIEKGGHWMVLEASSGPRSMA
jgi:hypothetical protein